MPEEVSTPKVGGKGHVIGRKWTIRNLNEEKTSISVTIFLSRLVLSQLELTILSLLSVLQRIGKEGGGYRSKSDRWPKTSDVTMSHLLKGQLYGPNPSHS